MESQMASKPTQPKELRHTVVTLSRDAKSRVDELCEKLKISPPLLIECLVMIDDDTAEATIKRNLEMIKLNRTNARLARKERRHEIQHLLETLPAEQLKAMLEKLGKE